MVKSAYLWPRMGIALIIIGICLSISPSAATIFSEKGLDLNESDLYNLTNSTKPSDVEKLSVFFYDPDCESCAPAHEYLKKYLVDNPDTQLEMISIADGTEERDRFNAQKTTFYREKVFVPVLYLGPVALEGSPDIIANFNDLYRWYTQ